MKRLEEKFDSLRGKMTPLKNYFYWKIERDVEILTTRAENNVPHHKVLSVEGKKNFPYSLYTLLITDILNKLDREYEQKFRAEPNLLSERAVYKLSMKKFDPFWFYRLLDKLSMIKMESFEIIEKK